VDDNATNRRILEELLSSWDMRPSVVEGGQTALTALTEARASGRPYPLVLLDSHMPAMSGFDLAERIKHHADLHDTTILMLTSAGAGEDIARCRQLGIQAYLTKPVKSSDLLESIHRVLSASPWQPRLETAPLPPRAAGRPLHILLAEDSAINQRLAVALLQKQGHRVMVAATGVEALTALERDTFDVILMDVQMPELDGLETTRHIRRQEKGTNRHLPIIAMTALAMKGDRERCLDVGMDHYISKPLHPQDLFDALAALPRETSRATPPAGPPPAAPPVIQLNRNEVLARVAGDEVLLRTLVKLFVESCPGQMAALRASIACGDAALVRRQAHTLKGAVLNFGVGNVVDAAFALERMGLENDLTGADEAWQRLDAALQGMPAALATLLED
jgi:CheY-like chemotaxis protein